VANVFSVIILFLGVVAVVEVVAVRLAVRLAFHLGMTF